MGCQLAVCCPPSLRAKLQSLRDSPYEDENESNNASGSGTGASRTQSKLENSVQEIQREGKENANDRIT
jgi:hypothetical protein